MIISENSSRHGYCSAEQCLGWLPNDERVVVGFVEHRVGWSYHGVGLDRGHRRPGERADHRHWAAGASMAMPVVLEADHRPDGRVTPTLGPTTSPPTPRPPSMATAMPIPEDSTSVPRRPRPSRRSRRRRRCRRHGRSRRRARSRRCRRARAARLGRPLRRRRSYVVR